MFYDGSHKNNVAFFKIAVTATCDSLKLQLKPQPPSGDLT